MTKWTSSNTTAASLDFVVIVPLSPSGPRKKTPNEASTRVDGSPGQARIRWRIRTSKILPVDNVSIR
jgi:hypothetical protein